MIYDDSDLGLPEWICVRADFLSYYDGVDEPDSRPAVELGLQIVAAVEELLSDHARPYADV